MQRTRIGTPQPAFGWALYGLGGKATSTIVFLIGPLMLTHSARLEEEQQQRDLESAGWTPGSALTNTATNPAAYLVDPAQRPVTAPPGQSEPVTAPPGQSAAADQLADQSAASARLISDQSAPEASGVSSLPVAAVTVP